MESDNIKKVDLKARTNWHRLFETINQMALTDVGLNTYTEFRLMSESPIVDLLLQRAESEWTAAQQDRVPDGIRHSHALHILGDLKKTESLNKRVLLKTLAYDTIYKSVQGLKDEDVQTFLLSAKTPQRAFFTRFDYEPTEHAGVYHSHNEAFCYVDIIVLNQLSDEPHNMFVKCFASREKEAQKAFDLFLQSDWNIYPQELVWYMYGLYQRWEKMLEKGGSQMENTLDIGTPEEILLAGRERHQRFLQRMPPEYRMVGLSPSERMAGLSAFDRVTGLSLEERLVGLPLDELKAYVERLNWVPSSNGNGSSAPS